MTSSEGWIGRPVIGSCENRGVVVTEAGSYLGLTDSRMTQLEAQGPCGTCNEKKKGILRCTLGVRARGPVDGGSTDADSTEIGSTVVGSIAVEM